MAALRAIQERWLESAIIAAIGCVAYGGTLLIARSRLMAVSGDAALPRASSVVVSALSLAAALAAAFIFGRAVAAGEVPARVGLAIGVPVVALVWLALRILRRNAI